MKYVDASVVLGVLFQQPGDRVTLAAGDTVVSSELVEVEAYRAIDRERLLGGLDDTGAAVELKELADFLLMLDLVPIDRAVIDRARGSYAVNARALDAIHVATAGLVAAESGEPVEFWTHDARQRLAALSRGLDVRGV